MTEFLETLNGIIFILGIAAVAIAAVVYICFSMTGAI